LPTVMTSTADTTASPKTSDMSPRKPARTILRAAEGGKGSLLPDHFSSPHPPTRREPPSRVRTRSSPSLNLIMNLPGSARMNRDNTQTLPQTVEANNEGGPTTTQVSMLQAAKQSLRRRTGSYVSDDEDGMGSSSRSNRGGGNSNTEHSPYHRTGGASHRRGRRTLTSFHKLLRMKLGHFLQILIVLAVTVLVWESHHKALFAAVQLTQFKEEESLLLLHLQKIEQQSIQLHENLNRLAKAGPNAKGAQDSNSLGAAAADSGEKVDFELIHKQTQQLYQMEEELNHEVKTLQTRIQQSARSHIVQEFGEGPVQVILELHFDQEGPSRISILLWHDTPHAAWTWLEQIGRHVWDGADFKWQEAHVIDAGPRKQDPLGGKIEFVEQGQHSHEAWTVGLKEDDGGSLGFYINLQDNKNYHKSEVCVGKVIDGFDALQRLLEVSRSKSYDKASIQIKSATAMHVTKREG
jgi:cyclophilin family peptidyl-prolyl cis-trans isomerase